MTQIQKKTKSGSLVNLKDSWRDGLQLSTCKRVDAVETKRFLYLEIKKIVDYIEAKKTLDSSGIRESVDFILEDYWNYTLDEICQVIRSMKKDTGYFERLKYPEINQKLKDCFDSEERANRIVRHHLDFKKKELSEPLIIDKKKNEEAQEKSIDYEAFKLRSSVEAMGPHLKKKNPNDYNNFKMKYLAKRKKNEKK